MASAIWNAKEKRWVLRMYFDGSIKKFTSKEKGLKGKRIVLAKAREYEDKNIYERKRVHVRAVWEMFMESSRKRLGEKSEACRLYEKIGRLYIIPAIGRELMYSLNKQAFQSIIDNAKPHTRRTNTLSRKYLSTIRMTLNVFIKWAVENDYYEGFKGTLYLPKGHPTIGKEILQPQDLRELFKPSEVHYHTALCFCVCSGLRPGELLGLKWEDINNGMLYVKRSINSLGEITDGKNDNARRIIPISPFLKNLLDEQRERTECLNSEWIFCARDGGKGSQSTLRHNFDKLKKERNLPGSLYSLRHTFISLIKNVVPEQQVKTIVGHSEGMDTFGVYGHLIDGELTNASKVIDLTLRNTISNVK